VAKIFGRHKIVSLSAEGYDSQQSIPEKWKKNIVNPVASQPSEETSRAFPLWKYKVRLSLYPPSV